MKKFLFALLAVLSFAASPAEIAVAKNGADEVVLTDEACTIDAAKKAMPAAMLSEAHRATAKVNGTRFEACYVVLDDTVGILYEDGDVGMLPKQIFRKVKNT